jgi:hypothetical protein
VNRGARRLARSLFHAIVRFGPGLEKRQAVLGRLVEISAELFAIAAACARAKAADATTRDTARRLTDVFCRTSRRRIEERFASLFANDDVAVYRTAQMVMKDEITWLETINRDATM